MILSTEEAASELLSLYLSSDNVSNCTLSTEDGTVLYAVYTEHTPKTVTQVRNEHGEVIASMEWRKTLSDRVTVGANKPVALSDWMKKSVIPFLSDISFVDDSQRSYKWKGYAVGQSLELHASDTKKPIAFFHKRRRVPNTEPPAWTEPKLIMDSRAKQIQDTVVISFLFLEKNRRIFERTSQNAADVRTLPLNVAGTGYRAHDGGIGV
ncbi:hypothetical protein EIP91_009310 [Steccherinum ochraceum]|uniref:DUF6593 domain-containing protein n=1 Tax=Steccherinum ochraceum TaxID=92696 RepID=A0A4R0R1R5_9APHY|nr:hypothetical protein EIP91_009310 [Steccherinum ochraceum]